MDSDEKGGRRKAYPRSLGNRRGRQRKRKTWVPLLKGGDEHIVSAWLGRNGRWSLTLLLLLLAGLTGGSWEGGRKSTDDEGLYMTSRSELKDDGRGG